MRLLLSLTRCSFLSAKSAQFSFIRWDVGSVPQSFFFPWWPCAFFWLSSVLHRCRTIYRFGGCDQSMSVFCPLWCLIVLARYLWAQDWRCKHTCVISDSATTVSMINQGRSSSPVTSLFKDTSLGSPSQFHSHRLSHSRWQERRDRVIISCQLSGFQDQDQTPVRPLLLFQLQAPS